MSPQAQISSFREARAAAGLTQEQIADRVGITSQAVSQWETGATVPLGSARILLAQVFGVPVPVVDGWFERAEQAKPEAA